MEEEKARYWRRGEGKGKREEEESENMSLIRKLNISALNPNGLRRDLTLSNPIPV